MFNNPFSLYTLPINAFKDIKTGFAEVVSDTSVKVLKNELFLNNGIKVILETYPELENYVKQSLEINI